MNKIITTSVIFSLILCGCGPSACDCAAIKGQSSAHGSYNIGGREVRASAEDDKRHELLMKCVDKFGSLNAAEADCKK